jgi:hypothetical protein
MRCPCGLGEAQGLKGRAELFDYVRDRGQSTEASKQRLALPRFPARGSGYVA